MNGTTHFVGRLLIFLAPLVCAFAGLEYVLTLLPNSLELKKRILESRLATTEILVLGSSHNYFGVDPARFSRPGVNLANTSQSLLLDEQLLSKYGARTPRLRVVLLDVSYFSLEYRLTDGVEAWRDHLYGRVFNIGEDRSLRASFDPTRFSYFWAYGPRQSVNLLRGRLRGERMTEGISPDGWYRARVGGTNASDADAGRQRVRYHESTMHPRNLLANVGTLTAILSSATKRGVRVVFISPPVFSTYAAAMDRGRWSAHQRLIRDLAGSYAAEYLDFTGDARFGAADYFDPDHLNLRGAEKFSGILEREALGTRGRAAHGALGVSGFSPVGEWTKVQWSRWRKLDRISSSSVRPLRVFLT